MIDDKITWVFVENTALPHLNRWMAQIRGFRLYFLPNMNTDYCRMMESRGLRGRKYGCSYEFNGGCLGADMYRDSPEEVKAQMERDARHMIAAATNWEEEDNGIA